MNRFEELVYGIVERRANRFTSTGRMENRARRNTRGNHEPAYRWAATTRALLARTLATASSSPLPATFRAAAACALRLLACHHAPLLRPHARGRKHVGRYARARCAMHPFNACFDHTTRQDFVSFSSLLSSRSLFVARRRRPRRRISKYRELRWRRKTEELG